MSNSNPSSGSDSHDANSDSPVLRVLRLPSATDAELYPESGELGVNTVRIGALHDENRVPVYPPSAEADVAASEQDSNRATTLASKLHAAAERIGESNQNTTPTSPEARRSQSRQSGSSTGGQSSRQQQGSPPSTPPPKSSQDASQSSSKKDLSLGASGTGTTTSTPNSTPASTSSEPTTPQPPNIDPAETDDGFPAKLVLAGFGVVIGMVSAFILGGGHAAAGVMTGSAGVALLYAYAATETSEDLIFILMGVLLLVVSADFFDLINLLF